MPARDGAPFRVFTVGPAEAMVDRLLALMGATETGRVEVSALADRRVNLLLAAADTDRDAAISQAEADARAEARMHGKERRHHGDRRRPRRRRSLGPSRWRGFAGRSGLGCARRSRPGAAGWPGLRPRDGSAGRAGPGSRPRRAGRAGARRGPRSRA